jgi:group I intron endonuclease
MIKKRDICTVYLLINTINNKIYIGQTWLQLSDRMGKDGINYRNSIYLYNAIRKYGSDNFIYKVLAECRDQVTADCFEEYFITWYDSKNLKIGYNIRDGGSAGKHSEETKLKISKSLKDKDWTPEALLGKGKGGSSWLGKKRGPQSKERAEATAARLKKWHLDNPHPMSGKHHSEATRKKLSAASRGRKFSKESIKKRSLKLMLSPEKEQDIIDAYQIGITIAEIKVKFNTGVTTIYRILKRNGIILKSKMNNNDNPDIIF